MNSPHFFYLPEPLLLKLTGRDRHRYLQGQITNNLEKLVPNEWMQACVLTPKGKLSALIQIAISEDQEALLIEADKSLQEELPARLERYMIADEVMLEALPAPQKVHLFGEYLNHPEVQALQGRMIHRLGEQGKDIELDQFLQVKELAVTEPLSLLEVEYLRVSRGVPRWGFELTSEVLPPEALLEESSIDYAKGCYLGQEIISRLRSVGRVNRLLTRFVGNVDSPLVTGMELYAQEEPSRKIGFLTSVAQDIRSNQPVALGYLRRDMVTPDGGLLAVDCVSGATASVTIKPKNGNGSW